MEDYSQADFFSESDAWMEELNLYRVFESRLPSGRYYLDVAYTWDEMPRSGGRTISSVPYTLEYTVFDVESTAQKIEPGIPVDFELGSVNGYLSHFTVDIPPGSEGFRIDVFDTPGDVDLYLAAGTPATGRDDYLVVSETYLGRESIVISGDEIPADGNTYYLTVFEGTSPEFPVPVRLAVSLGTGPPESAPRVSVLPEGGDNLDLSRISTVQLVSSSGIGSGCLVSSRGLIITNNHVVRDDGDNIVPVIYVALSLDPFEAPEELFSGKVIRTSPEDDLALVQITGDRWGRPLSSSFRFPFWQLGRPGELNIGDSLLLMGYPWMGSGLSRTYFTITRGILSGGERPPGGLILKTDAVIAGGSSGGAVSDGGGRLLGLPTFVVSQDAAQLTYFVPVDRIPGDWRGLF
jgi:S1-C subfamily serine protease